MAGSTAKNFRFYKLFCPETSSKKLEIPILFREFVGGVIPNKVILRNSLKKDWSMEIRETGDGLYFRNGWANFVKDNSIRNGDCLFFAYGGNGLFDFVLFEQSGCEKKVMTYKQTQVKIEVEDDDDTDQDDDEEDSDFVIEVDKNEVEGEKDDEEVKATSKRSKNNDCGSKKGVGASVGEGSSSKKNKDVFDHFGTHIFKSGEYTQPKNPYFVTKLGRKERHTLYIPVDVIKDYNIELPPTLMLRDPRGQEWKANVHVWGDGRTWLSGEWRNMCKWNLIGEDDMFICEFVRPRRGDMFLQVTIVRGQAAN